MSCPVNFDTVRNGIVNKASEMLQQSGAFTVSGNIAKVTDENIDYGKSVMGVNNAFGEQVVKKLTKESIEENRKKEIEEFVTNIFPDTQVKDIVYRGDENFNVGDNILSRVDNNKYTNGIYFAKTKREASGYINDVKKKSTHVFSAILNLQNPKITDVYDKEITTNALTEEQINFLKSKNIDGLDIGLSGEQGFEYLVFEPEQIHILTEEELKQIDEINKKYDELSYEISPSEGLVNKYLDATPKESTTIKELIPKQIIQNVIKGFELYTVEEGFGNIRFKSKNQKASRKLAASINKWLKKNGWDNKVLFAYEGTYGTINPFVKRSGEFEVYSNGFGTTDPQLESKYFSKGNTTSKQILLDISKSTHPLASTAEILLNYADLINVPISLETNDTIGTMERDIVYYNESNKEVTQKIKFVPAGSYSSSTKSIAINKDAQFKELGSEPTIIHEILHAYTEEFINTSDANIVGELDNILQHLKKNASKISDKYAILNKDELLVAFFTNTSFIKDLQKIEPIGKYNNYKNLWQQLYDYITGLFNFSSKEKSLYSEVYGLMTNIVEEGVQFEYNKRIALEQFYEDQNNFFDTNEELVEDDWEKVWENVEKSSTDSMMLYVVPAFDDPRKQYATFYRDALPSEFDRKSRGNFKDEEISNKTLERVIKRLQKIFPDLKIKTISPYELDQKDHSIPVNEINSFVKGDTVYLVEGRNSLSMKIEELLHPFVHALKDDNPELFNNLFEASKSSLIKEYNFYKNRLGEDVAKEEVVTKALQQGLLKVKNPSLYEQFISFLKEIFQSIFPFSSTSNKLTSGFSTDLTIDDLAKLLMNGGFNFRTDYLQNPYYNASDGKQWAEDARNRIKDYWKNQGVEKVEDADGNSFYRRLNKKLVRVTEIANARVKEFWKGKKQLTEEQEAFRDLARDEGSNIHQAIEKIAYKFVDPDTGILRYTPIDLGVNDTGVSNDSYKKLEQLVKDRLYAYKDMYGYDVRFLFEQIIYNSKKNVAGTIDFIAITPDKKIHIRDWKTTQRELNPSFDPTKPVDKNNRKYINETDKPFKLWKRISWDTQLQEYKEALSNITGASLDDFNVVRIDPILIEYDIDGKELVNISTPVKDGVYSKNRQSIPYISKAESFENKNLKTLFNKIRDLARITIEKQKVETGENWKYNYQLDEQVEKMIQDFYLFNQLEGIYNLHVDIYNEVSRTLSMLSDVENLAIDDMTVIMKELQLGQELLSSLDYLMVAAREIYGENLEKSILTEKEKANEKRVELEKEFKTSLLEFQNALDVLDKNFSKERARILKLIAEQYGIDKIETVEKKISDNQLLFSSTSSAKTRAVALLYKILKPIWPKVDIIMRDRKEKLTDLKYNLDKWAKQNGKTFKEAMDFFIDKSEGKLKGKFSSEFFKDRNEILRSNDLKRIKSFFKTYYRWDDLKAEYDKRLKEGIDEINNSKYSGKDVKEFKKRKIENLKKKWDLENSVDAYSYIALDWLNESEDFKAKYYTEFYKELTRPGNETLYSVYSYFIDINKKTFEAGGISYNEIFTFIPKIRKSLMEKGLPALNPKEIWSSLSDSIKVDSNDEFGKINMATGEVEKNYYIPYTQNIFGDDYSDMNFDLFATYSQFSEGMETGFAMKEMLPFTKVLLDFEKRKPVTEISKSGGRLKQAKGDDKGNSIEVMRDNNWRYLETHIDAIVYGRTLQKTFDHVWKSTRTVTKKDDEGNDYQEEETQYYSLARIIQNGMSWMYYNTFGLNFSTPVRQYIAGIGHQYFTAGRHFSGKEMAENERVLSTFFDLISSNKDVKDKKAVALDFFMPYLDNEYKLQSKELSADYSTKLFQPENLMFLLRKGSRMNQANIFMTLMDNFIVVDGEIHNVYDYVKKKNQNLYVNSAKDIKELREKEKEEIKQLKENNSIYNYLQVEEKEVGGKKKKYLSIKELNELDVIQKIQGLTHFYSKRVTGENAKGDFYGYRAHMIGRMAGMYRNWIPRTVQARMGKFQYNGDIESFEWGRWGAYMSVLQEATKEHKLGMVRHFFGFAKQDELIDYARTKLQKIRQEMEENNREIVDFDSIFSEREFIDMYLENYRKSVIEFRIISGMMLILFSGVFAIDDDDDEFTKGIKRFAHFQFDRMQDEYSFYINPKSATQLVGTVFPGVTYINNVLSAIGNSLAEMLYFAVQDEDKLKSNKPLKYWLKSIPVMNQFILYYSLFDPEFAKDLGVKPFTVRNI